MTNNSKEDVKPDAKDEQKEKNEARTKLVTDFLNENKLDIQSQMFIVLENGETLPIRGFTTQSFVIEQNGPDKVESKNEENTPQRKEE